MNKAELIEEVANQTGLTQKVAGKVVYEVISVINDCLAKGEKVTLVGFGTFTVKQRKARTGRNPQTGATIQIPAKKVPRFAAGKTLKDKVG